MQERVSAACDACGRPASSVAIVAASKTRSIETILEAHALGVNVFGESKMQEALPKIAALPQVERWRFIGKLQSNKVKFLAPFEALETLESPAQLKELAKLERPIEALIQVNIGREPQKSGILPENATEFVESALQCKQVSFRGFMTIGPAVRNAEEMRPYFRSLFALNERFGGTCLSMGMSDDFEVAIQEGSTHIRIGSALFGARHN